MFANSRWLSPDPADANWNAYAYVTDPNRETDPTGLWCVWEDNTHDDDPANDNPLPGKPSKGGATQKECEEQGGHWDPFDTIYGIRTDQHGLVTEITFAGEHNVNVSYDTSKLGLTLEGFDQTLQNYQQLPGGNIPRDFLGQPLGALGLWFDRTWLGKWLNRQDSKFLMDPDKMDVVACSLAPDANNDIKELDAQMNGEKTSPVDEGHPEGGKPVWAPNLNTTKNGGGTTRTTPWGELTVEPGSESIGEEKQGGPAAITIVTDWAASAATCMRK